MNKSKKYTKSSGNVFKDLGLANSEERLVKAKLAKKINEIIEAKNLLQIEAAKILGIDQPRVSDLSKGKLSGFTIERLLKFLTTLNLDVDIVFKNTAISLKKHKGHIRVVDAEVTSKDFNHSKAGQVKYWAKIGKIAEENPELSFDFIKQRILSKENGISGKTLRE